MKIKDHDRLAKFTALADECAELAERVKRAIEQRASETPFPHWGDIGDMQRMRGVLKDLDDALHGTGEYAEVE